MVWLWFGWQNSEFSQLKGFYWFHLVLLALLFIYIKNFLLYSCSQFICSYRDLFMVLEVKWERISDILDLKNFINRDINVNISLFTKFKHTFVAIFFFGEMTFVGLKSFVSIISNTKLYHWWNFRFSPVQLVSQERKRLFLLKPFYYKCIIFLILRDAFCFYWLCDS